VKILFVYKYNYIEPIGLMSLSAALKKAGFETFFFDIALDWNLKGFVHHLKPEVIAYSVITGNHKMYAELNKELKKTHRFFSLFGGPHTTFFPEFINEPGVDAICRGEGEAAFTELVEKLKNKQPLTDIKNLWIKRDEKIFKNTVRDLEENLDELEFPDRGLVYKYDAYKKRSNKYVLTSRGCPFSCTYCFNHSLKKIYKGKGCFCRKRSINNVIKELQELTAFAPVKRIQFFDDVFILDKQWVLDFCREYKTTLGLPFICYVRVNLVDEEIIESLKKAGVVTIAFAIETGDSFLRNEVLKRGISDRQIIQTAELLHKYDIKFFTQNMVGLPGETLCQALKTVSLNVLCKPSYANASLFQPYPGVELTEYAIEKGYYKRDKEILHDSFYETSVLELKEKKELKNLCRLFSIVVEFEKLLPLVEKIIRGSGADIFKVIWHITRSYGYFFRINWIDASDVFLPLFEKTKQGLKRIKF